MPLIPSAHVATLATVTATFYLRTVSGRTLTSKPTRKQRRNQTQQVIKHRNRLGDDPRYRPQHQPDHHPRPNRAHTALVHQVRAPEEPDVDVLACDVSVYHACYHNLNTVSFPSQYRGEKKRRGGVPSEWQFHTRSSTTKAPCSPTPATQHRPRHTGISRSRRRYT